LGYIQGKTLRFLSQDRSPVNDFICVKSKDRFQRTVFQQTLIIAGLGFKNKNNVQENLKIG